MIRGHGDDLYKYEDIRLNFSSNVYAHTDNEALLQHLEAKVKTITGSYPEPEPYLLQKELAKHHGVAPECILVTNGATEAIYLIAHLLEGENVEIIEPTFSEYRSACELFHVDIHSGATHRWICNPNNPTGRVQSEDTHPEGILVVDRSYEYFCRKPLPELQIDDRHIYIYSLTKRYKIPGLRIGYIITSSCLAERVRALRQPWSVNALAIEAGLWIAHNQFPETINRELLWREADELSQALANHPAIKVEPTDTHFILVKTSMIASILKERLALEYGILIRDASNFEGLSPYHIRIASQGREENKVLFNALSDILSVETM